MAYRGPGPVLAPGLPLRSGRMPLLWHGRPLKRWRWVGAFGDELLLCACVARIGPVRQGFWAVWDRRARRLHEGISRLRIAARVDLDPGRVSIRGAEMTAVIEFPEEAAGVETLLGDGGPGFVWTRKRAGLPGRCRVDLGQGPRESTMAVCIDDTAGYHRRLTRWRWSTGAGQLSDGRAVAWNLVSGVNDPAVGSERTVWLDGEPAEAGPVRFAEDLTWIEGSDGRLRFAAEASRVHHERLGPVSSAYRAELGRFEGQLPGTGQLAAGLGVMERHEARW